MPLRPRSRRSHERFLPTPLLTLVLCGLALFPGCRKPGDASDAELQPIYALLRTNLPPGTPQAEVAQFLQARSFPTEPADRPGTLVAVIPVNKSEAIHPIEARVTFYFDANGKLNTFELARLKQKLP